MIVVWIILICFAIMILGFACIGVMDVFCYDKYIDKIFTLEWDMSNIEKVHREVLAYGKPCTVIYVKMTDNLNIQFRVHPSKFMKTIFRIYMLDIPYLEVPPDDDVHIFTLYPDMSNYGQIVQKITYTKYNEDSDIFMIKFPYDGGLNYRVTIGVDKVLSILKMKKGLYDLDNITLSEKSTHRVEDINTYSSDCDNDFDYSPMTIYNIFDRKTEGVEKYITGMISHMKEDYSIYWVDVKNGDYMSKPYEHVCDVLKDMDNEINDSYVDDDGRTHILYRICVIVADSIDSHHDVISCISESSLEYVAIVSIKDGTVVITASDRYAIRYIKDLEVSN